jgi:hypothetical protein
VIGSVTHFAKPKKETFNLICSSRGARSAIIVRNVKVDKATLILRQGQDGRYAQVDLADLFQGDVHDNIVASIAPVNDPKDHAQLVYWLIVKPQNAKYPVPEEVI